MKTKEVKELISERITWWKAKMGLGYWNVRYDFQKGKPEQLEDGFQICARCGADWAHEDALITFYPKAMKNYSEDEIENTVVHELLHIFVNEMRQKGLDHEERVVTELAKAFIWVRDGAIVNA